MVAFTFIIYLILDKLTFSSLLFKESLEMQKRIQNGVEQSTVDYYGIITRFGNEFLYGIFGLIYLIDRNRIRVWTFLITFT